MPKIFQNKSFLKSIKVFLLCLIIFTGFLGKADIIQGASCTGDKDRPGLVPCGRECDVTTTSYHEDAPCTICHLILMMQLIMDFLFKIAAVVAAFFIAASGTMYIFSAGRPEMLSLAKTTFKLTLLGFGLIFTAWILVNTILTMFGYIDPLENNEWHIMC